MRSPVQRRFRIHLIAHQVVVNKRRAAAAAAKLLL